MVIMDSPSAPVPPTAHRRDDARPFARVWRWVAALAIVVSAVVHLVLYVDGYSDISVVGPLFLLNAAGGLVLAVLLVLWRHWLPLVGGIGFGVATLIAFVLSTTVGFYGVAGETFFGTNQLVAAVSEALAVAASTVALLREYLR